MRVGAEAEMTNDSGSTALTLAQWTTGRGGTGSPEAKHEQELIVGMLTYSPGRPQYEAIFNYGFETL